ncbi:MAG: hypothetical protein RSJ41_00075 [Clostridia bacterium]
MAGLQADLQVERLKRLFRLAQRKACAKRVKQQADQQEQQLLR